MDDQTNASRSSLVRLWPWLVVLLVLLFIGFVRFRLLDMPLERDEGEYAYAGQLILQGIPPYELAYNMKLPGTYYAYALGMAVFGQTIAGIHLTLLVVNLSTIVFIFLLGREILGVTAGLVACVSYGLISTSPAVLGLAAHATQFVVFFAVPGTLFLWRGLQSGRSGTLFLSGLLYGLGFVMKQHGICFCAFGLLALLWRERTQSPRGLLKDSAKRIALFILGTTLPFLMICLLLAQAGVFAKFWFWTFSYARAYATNLSPGEGFGKLSEYLCSRFIFFVGFWILVVVGWLIALFNRADQKRLAFPLAFFFFSFLGTVPGFYFRAHYFVLLLPAFALMVGLAAELLCSMSPARTVKIALLVFPISVLAWNIWLQQGIFFQLPAQPLTQIIYGLNPFVESFKVGSYIREHSTKDDRVVVVGSEPEIYFYAQRHSATGYIYTYPLMEDQPYAVTMQHEMINEIESARPEYIVMINNSASWARRQTSDAEIFNWTQTYTARHYDRVGLVDCPLGRPGTELWDGAAANYSGQLEQSLDVYRRKPGDR